ncbi:malectin domain-containing carbohydrate-binding protein [Granulicella sp. dw_53]|uniref:malectin domain-containing carbohydrate-binding protein n=1 Tax=Granulicella sp. dw_53 TaxID=2719792 RepID=UPI001BD23115|nr:malectin domain-containing carbohydrate-binding protein [Granulicella sp. dw_53]
MSILSQCVSSLRSFRFFGAALALLLSAAVPSFAQFNSTIFGPNVYVFDPSVAGATINSQLDVISNASVASAQFSTNRYAVLFKPGTYSGVSHQVGFYLSVAGLGTTPDATVLNGGGLYLDVTDGSGNVTTNFWRSLENLRINVPTGGTDRWAVAQGAAFRRMHVAGNLELTNASCGFASGGFIADSTIDGQLNECSQQQWYTRNSTIGSFAGFVWNFVFSGVTGAPAQNFPNVTTLATTPVVREKPYLYVDSAGNYNVFVPALKTSSSGTSWAGGGLGTGSSLAISTFFIATPANTAAQINSALATGKNLILTPGIYSLTAPIAITHPNTVVLGLGYPTLVPQSGTPAMTVADVDGVQLAGLLIDAGITNSSVLLQVGVSGAARVTHAANPTSLSDVFFRIGGATAGSATTSLQIDSNNVILDNIWAWRADHGAGVGWANNTAAHGLVVNGDNVTALGLAVEHYQQSQVQWNGNGGETIFYQSEDPYDVPSQGSWMDGAMNGYPSYEVTSAVCAHTAYGLGVYSFFNQGVAIFQDNAIHVPNTTGINMTDMVTVKLNGSGGINNIINGTGGPTPAGASANNLGSYVGNGACSTSTTNVDINVGGAAVPPFIADQYFTGGGSASTTHAIVTSGVTNPAPQAVYQSNRAGVITYTIPGFTAGSTHTVRLHFAEIYFSTAGQRVFNVAINGVPVLSNFDIIATAGARYTANVQQFNTTANSSGQIVLSLTRGAVDQPELSGIEVQ